ncbi:kinesin-like protein KIFC3 isoform X2 [Dendropsophus ebraccatus]|uniref:kinesin-like protein KIFC3 isoform X2 n=1 Tax=Dendropsophus ebraccatus TaxID=150705 RepID=UPI0038319855
MLQNEIRPLYVFDGIPPENKRLRAPSEAEATCAHLVVEKVAWGAVTEDMDALPFSCCRLIRNLKADKNIVIKEYDLPTILSNLNLSKEQFVDLCILLGCDYTTKIKGLGRKKALEMIQKHKNIEGIIQEIKSEKRTPPDFDYITARRQFLHPVVATVSPNDLKWRKPDEEKVRQFLSGEKHMKEVRVTSVLQKLHPTKKTQKRRSKMSESLPRKQMKINTFFRVTKMAHEVKDGETNKGAAQSKHPTLWTELDELDNSDDSSEVSGSEDEAADAGHFPLEDLSSPLSDFLAYKQESASEQTSATNPDKPASPLLTVMSHLLTFLEHYSQMQRLQGQAQDYRHQLQREEHRRKKQLRSLQEAHKQRMRDKMSLIESLESVICEQQSVLERLQRGVLCGAHPVSTLPPVHKLVESISVLQLERAKLQEEVGELKQDIEQKEKEQQEVSGSLLQQIEELKVKIQEREEELSHLRAEMGVTDSEKQIQNLSVENENLKQSLNMTQGLLEKLAAVNSQPSTQLLKENEELRSKVHHLETSLQDKVEQLVYTKGHIDNLQWRKEEETRHLEEKVQGLKLSLENEKKRPPDVQYVTQTVEVESPLLLHSLEKAEERNRTLQEQVSGQSEKCQRLEEQLRRSEDLTTSLQSKITAYESEIGKLKEELMQEIHQLEAQKDEAIKEASECSEQHMEQLRRQLLGMQSRLASLQPVLKSMKSNYNSLRSQVRNFSQFYEASIREARRQICCAVTDVSEANKDLLQKYQREMQLRKRYHNQLVELKGNIRVLCRLRRHMDTAEEEATAIITDINDDTRLSLHYKGKDRNFELDKVFLPHTTQEEVFQEIEPVVMSCINGYNVCIFAYGQTGSGKTYTMEGTAENPGINQQALQALYQEMEARRGLWSYSVSLSMVEIYNEVIRDLLSKDPQEKLDVKLNPDGSGQLHVPGLTSKEVKNFRHIKKILTLGKRNRATFCTNMNERSSRSHALLTITITGQELSSGAVTTGKLNLVDLAGSERVWKSGAEGERLKEAQNINKSLLALGEVIQALRTKQAHVPFRNSKLTYLLQDSLGKGNKTVMMVQVSPLESNLGETICSLIFAQRVCKVELGPASRRIDVTRPET